MRKKRTTKSRKPIEALTGRTIEYLRVSTDDQVATGAGLAAQRDACDAYARRLGWEITGVFEEVEGLSGDTPIDQCPKLGEAVESMIPGDVLLVQKRDRIARDRMKIAMLEAMLRNRGCRLISASGEGTEADDPDDPMAFLMRGIVDLFAEFEKLIIRFRTKASLRAKRRRLERTGKVPYGFDLTDDGKRSKLKTVRQRDGTELKTGGRPIALVENAQEQAVIARMKHWRDVLGFTYREIAKRLNDEGIRTKAGKPWNASSVHCILNRDPHVPEETTSSSNTA